jgi:hypothetical protein
MYNETSLRVRVTILQWQHNSETVIYVSVCVCGVVVITV